MPDKFNHEKDFLPRKSLESICTFDTVLGVLQPMLHDPDRARRCAEFVCGSPEEPSYDHKTSTREIFAILVLIESVNLILDVQNAGLRDDDLPFRCSEQQAALWSRYSNENNPLEFFPDRWARAGFYQKQWFIHVPFIARDEESGKAFEYQFEPGTVMPWTYVSPHTEKGGFGEVQRVKIHPDHHALVCFVKDPYLLPQLTCVCIGRLWEFCTQDPH